MTTAGKSLSALVLPGGGFRGAYQAGALIEFAKGDLHFDIIVGASVGACNGAAFVLGMAPDLDTYWEQAVTRGIFKPSRLLRGRNPFKISNVLDGFAQEHGNRARIAEVDSPVQFLVSVTEVEEAKNVIFNLRDPNWTRKEKILQYLASSSIPLLCKPVEIRGKKYVDGGITDNCPIQAAIDLGAEEIWVVEMGDNSHWERRLRSLLHWGLRAWPRPRGAIKLAQALVAPAPPLSVPSTTVIHRLSPSIPLDIASLYLTREKVLATIELGKKDAQNFLANLPVSKVVTPQNAKRRVQSQSG